MISESVTKVVWDEIIGVYKLTRDQCVFADLIVYEDKGGRLLIHVEKIVRPKNIV